MELSAPITTVPWLGCSTIDFTVSTFVGSGSLSAPPKAPEMTSRVTGTPLVVVAESSSATGGLLRGSTTDICTVAVFVPPLPSVTE